jgi:hypothetical protein
MLLQIWSGLFILGADPDANFLPLPDPGSGGQKLYLIRGVRIPDPDPRRR